MTFEPGSSFPQHAHGGGEEFLVLAGDFCDDLTGACQVVLRCSCALRDRHHPRIAWTWRQAMQHRVLIQKTVATLLLTIKRGLTRIGLSVQEGTYVRHPIGSSHEPWSVAGGTILVKLRQMADRGERQRTVVDAASWRREHPGAAAAVRRNCCSSRVFPALMRSYGRPGENQRKCEVRALIRVEQSLSSSLASLAN